MKLNKILKNKEKIYIILCFIIGATLFISGTFMYFMTPKSTKTTVQKRETEDSFKLYFTEAATTSDNSQISLNVNVEDINISSGDKGIGILSFELEYDSNALQKTSVYSTGVQSTIKENNNKYMLIVSNGNIITSDSSLLTINFIKKEDFTGTETTVSLKSIKGSSGNTVSATDISTEISFSENYEEVLDDDTAPTITFSPNGNSSCQERASTVVTVEDAEGNLIDSSLKYVWITDTTPGTSETLWRKFNSGDTISKSTVSGTYSLCVYAKDSANNERHMCSLSFQIDGAKPPRPIITGTGMSNNEYSGNVELTISGESSCSGIREYQYSLNNGESWTTYDSNNKPIISTEGVTNVIAKSINNFGVESLNSDPYVVNVTRPNMNLRYISSTNSPTNQNVTIRILSNTKLERVEGEGWELSPGRYEVSKRFETNKTERIEVEDIYGNIIPLTIIVNQIDKKAPTLSVKSNHTSDYDEVTITSDEALKPIEGWLLSNDKRSLKKIYYNNASEEVVVSDLANNQVTVPISIENITQKFDIDVQYIKTSENKLKVIISSQNSTLEPITGWDISSDNKKLKKEFDYEVNDIIKVTSSGVTKSVKLLYALPDDDIDLTVSYSQDNKTNEDILVSITGEKELKPIEGWDLSDDKLSLTKIYSENIKESIVVTTIDNKIKKVDINIDNIDKVLPEILNVSNNGVYSEIRLEFNKIIDKLSITKDGKEISSENIDVLTEEGNYEISLYDEVGNNNHYNLRIAQDQVVNVENTNKTSNIIVILLGLFEIIIGILIVRNFKINKKVNIGILLFTIVILGFNSSYAAEKTAFELNGYVVKNNNNLYGVEATTTVNNMKDNFDNSSDLSIARTSGYMSTGDTIGYEGQDYTIIVSGDVNSDGQITNTDIDNLGNFIIQNGSLTTQQTLAANYNQDSKIDISDLYNMNKRVVKDNYVIKAKNVKIRVPDEVSVGHNADIEYKVYPSNTSESKNYSIVSGKASSYVTQNGNTVTINGIKNGTSKIRFQVGNAYVEKEYNVKESHKIHFIYSSSGADCMILESNGEYGMIDTCFGNDTAIKRVNKKMDELGAKYLKFLILTHNHKDHVGGAPNVIDKYFTDGTTLYTKRYSTYGNYDKRIELENQYQSIVSQARSKGATVKEIGTTDAFGNCIAGQCTSSFDPNDRNISLGKFNIKLYNLDETISRIERIGEISENNNSLTQLVSITLNGKTTYTYLEGDLSYFKNKSKTYLNGKSVKQKILEEVLTDVGKGNKVDVFKAAHHGYYNAISYAEVKSLKPKYIIATSREASINETKEKEMAAEKNKTNPDYSTPQRRFCGAKTAKKYFEESDRNSFESGFISFTSDSNVKDKNIEVDYSTGDVVVRGGSSWSAVYNISDNCQDRFEKNSKKIKEYLCTRECNGLDKSDIMKQDFIDKYAK